MRGGEQRIDVAFGSRGLRDRRYLSEVEAERLRKAGPAKPARRSSLLSGRLLTSLWAAAALMTAFTIIPAAIKDAVSTASAPSASPGVIDSSTLDVAIYLTRPDGELETSALDRRLNAVCMPGKTRPTAPVAASEPTLNERVVMPYRALRAYLTCSARIARERFCDRFYRARFVRRLRTYISARSTEISRMRTAVNGPRTRANAAILARTPRVGGPDSAYRIPNANELPEEVGQIIFALSDDSLLSSNDFGWFGRNSIPRPVRPYMSRSPSKDLC